MYVRVDRHLTLRNSRSITFLLNSTSSQPSAIPNSIWRSLPGNYELIHKTKRASHRHFSCVYYYLFVVPLHSRRSWKCQNQQDHRTSTFVPMWQRWRRRSCHKIPLSQQHDSQSNPREGPPRCQSTWQCLAADFEGILRHAGCSLLSTASEEWRYDWSYAPWLQAEARLCWFEEMNSFVHARHAPYSMRCIASYTSRIYI